MKPLTLKFGRANRKPARNIENCDKCPVENEVYGLGIP